jgi:hypothetical protein
LKKLKSIPLHPFLWALFAPLALLGNNISQINPVISIRALLVILALTLLLLGAFRLIMRDWNKAAIVVTGFLVLFFSYGHIYDLIQKRLLFGVNIGRHRVLVALFIVALAVIIFGVTRRSNWLGLTTALNLIGAVALIFPLYQIISYRIRVPDPRASTTNQGLQAQIANLSLPAGMKPPDIYYIILDTYTRADTLEEYFSYDNSSFIESLRSQGFYVAGCSQSNFSFTDLSLASSLNFNYPQTLSTSFSATNKNISDIYPYISDSGVAYALHKLGYRFEAIDSGYSPTELSNADVYYSPEGSWHNLLPVGGINSFESMLLNTSAGMLIYEFDSYLPSSLQAFLSAYVQHRERILYALDVLDEISTAPGPKFVFVHILAPHNPFVFGPSGEPVKRKTPFTLNDDQDVVKFEDYVAGYRNQVTYLNQRMLAIVDSLIKNSNQPPIIIIQGDHGVPRLPGSEDTILNAYYLPGTESKDLYPSISPVNTFRVIFDHYFAGQLPLLDDQSCKMNPSRDPFSCVPAIDPNPECLALQGRQNP